MSVTLELLPLGKGRTRKRKASKTANGWWTMASHNPISHWLGKPCIEFSHVTESNALAVIVIETIHHALLNLDSTMKRVLVTASIAESPITLKNSVVAGN